MVEILLIKEVDFQTIVAFQTLCWVLTMWKFQDFSVIEILREINFGEYKSSKTAYLAIMETLNFGNFVNFSLQKRAKIHPSQNSEPLIVFKWQCLDLKNHQL